MAGLVFYDAVLNNDLDRVKRIVGQNKIDLNAKFVEVRKKNHADLCPIHLASYRGYTYMLQFIIDSRCDVDKTTATLRRTALHFAVLRHKMASLLLLIAAGAKIDVKDTFANTPCHYAADDGFCQILDVVIRRGVNVNAQDITFKTPLMKAVRNNKTDAVLRLLRAKCNLSLVDKNNDTALHYSARNGHADTIDCLISAGCPINNQNCWGRTPLMEAVCYNQREAVAMLIRADCDLHRRDFKTGDTALHIAIKRNYTCVIEYLLTAGSRHDVFNHQGETAAYQAIVGKKIDVIKVMLVQNCDLDATALYYFDLPKKSLFQISAEKGHFDICRLLASYGYIDYAAVPHLQSAYVSNRIGSGYEAAAQWLRKELFTPQSLQKVSRKIIRKHIDRGIVEKVGALNIPRALKDYILVNEDNFISDSCNFI